MSIKKRILLVEDSEPMRDLFKTMLKSDFDVDIAENGKKALEKLASQCFDGIVSDFQMPVMSGDEMAREIEQKGEKYLILFLSADFYGFNVGKYPSRNYRMLEKPVGKSQLINAAKNLFCMGTQGVEPRTP